MWASFSLLLVVLTLALSLRFYWSHCWPPSGPSATALRRDWQGPKLDSTNWKSTSTGTPRVSRSSKHDSTSLKTTQTA